MSLLSECCCARPDERFEVQGKEGVCSKCKEHTEFYNEDEEEAPVQGDCLVCVSSITMPSFPANYVVAEGEMVVLDGYIHGNPVIKLDSVLHPPTYKHLSHCSSMLEIGVFNKHFKKVSVG